MISILPGHQSLLFAAANLLSYAAAGVFVWSNRRIPGLLPIAFGGALNLTAIVANSGTMPASARALAASGWRGRSRGTSPTQRCWPIRGLPCSATSSPRPRWLPGHDVFSIGDVVIVIGFALLVYKTCAAAPDTDGPEIDELAPEARASAAIATPRRAP